MALNAYFILHKEIMYSQWSRSYDPPEYGCPNDIVVAETKAKARYLFWKHNQKDLDDLRDLEIEECTLILEDVPGEPRVVDYNDPDNLLYWDAVTFRHATKYQEFKEWFALSKDDLVATLTHCQAWLAPTNPLWKEIEDIRTNHYAAIEYEV